MKDKPTRTEDAPQSCSHTSRKQILGVELQTRSLPILAVDGGECSALCPVTCLHG
jgi:hypothetical protein